MTPFEEYGIITEKAIEKLVDDKSVRISLPGWGDLHIERKLPYLFVYRKSQKNDRGLDIMVRQEASHLICSGKRTLHKGVRLLVNRLVDELTREFGTFLLIEVWAGSSIATGETVSQQDLRPEFTLFYNKNQQLVQKFCEALASVQMIVGKAQIKTFCQSKCRPGTLPALISNKTDCYTIGIEVSPVFREPKTGDLYPKAFRKINRQFNLAMHKALFSYMRRFTSKNPPHFKSLGRMKVEQLVWKIDKKLAEISSGLELLLNVTPVNSDSAWNAFRRSRYSRAPEFFYRPLLKDPLLLKRSLYELPLEKVVDPSFSFLFREKADELDRQITLLHDRSTKNFHKESLQLYGEIPDDVVELAENILVLKQKRRRIRGYYPAEYLAAEARKIIKQYSERVPCTNSVQVRKDVAGILVSNGNLLINDKYKVAVDRLDPLLQHEVGTHILTYLNGKQQPLQLLSAGLSSYDPFQEGIAVLSEYLTGGLSVSRLRVIAIRVIAVKVLNEGGSFTDCFNLLIKNYGVSKKVAFTITMRVYRCGGFSKDAIYLTGLKEIFRYIQKGGDLEVLFTGKIACRHIPVIQELLWRGVLKKPDLMPDYLDRKEAQIKLADIKNGLNIIDILKG